MRYRGRRVDSELQNRLGDLREISRLENAEVLETEIGSTLSDINADLDFAVPSITGTVTSESGGGVPGIYVEVYDYFEDAPGWFATNWSVTDDQGAYEVYGCADGDHSVHFVDWDPSDGYYADEYFDNVELLENATTIETAVLSTTTDINAVLREGVASITGRVTDEATDDAVEGIFVSALQYDADWEGWWDTAWAETDEDGHYALYNAGTGERVVNFWDWTHTYRSEYWENQPQLESADIVDVTRGVTVEDIDASLVYAEPSITGVVTDADTGDPIEGVSVMAWVAEDEGWASEWMEFTDADGEYSLVDLPEGTYYVGFGDDWMGGGSYVPEYYDDQPDLESADPVEVVTGVVTDGINASLEPTYEEAAISGRIFNQVTMEPVGVGWVSLYRKGWRGRWDYVNEAWPKPDGTYGFYWVEPGQYKVGFNGEGVYIDEYWDNKSSVADADWITFDDDYTPVTGIDAGLVPFDVPADPVPPTVTDDAKDYYLGSALITISAEDNWAGVDTITYILDGTGHQVTTENPTEVSTSVIGMHSLTYWAADKEGNISEHVTRKFRVAVGAETERLSDLSRYSTALKLAREAFDPDGNKSWPDVGHIVISSGEDRAAADPLAASGLCWAYDAPLFLVKKDSVPSEVSAAVREIVAANGPVEVHIVGGPDSVPDGRFTDLVKAVGAGKLTKDRVLAIGNRYDLAAEIAREMVRVSGDTPQVALVANGADPKKFFDALALSPVAASEGYPILLVSADEVPAATKAVLGELKPGRVVVGGGAKTVSERVRILVRGERWSGADRYSTATTIADKAIGAGWLDYQCVGIAAMLPDALTGGSVVGSMNGPLVLTDGDSLSAATGNWLFKHRAAIRDCYVFGGERSVTATVRKQIEAKLR
ncbi:MAG: cell wall-binding repeat-containing protein [Actinomycetota bacterium]|nr:cell wall-binding repeat-containing protein [Actinomycetota bacterium]